MCELMDEYVKKYAKEYAKEYAYNERNIGMTQGKISMLKELIKEKLGSLTPEITVRVNAYPSEELDGLAIEIVRAKNSHEIQKILTR